jgi:hypothetical protein
MQVRPYSPSLDPQFIQGSPKAKSQLTKANQTKTKMESLARELQKVSGVMVDNIMLN